MRAAERAAQADEGYSARPTAGFWPWSNPQPDGTLGPTSRPALADALETRLPMSPDSHPTLRRRLHRPGFGFAYAGVIWTPDRRSEGA